MLKLLFLISPLLSAIACDSKIETINGMNQNSRSVSSDDNENSEPKLVDPSKTFGFDQKGVVAVPGTSLVENPCVVVDDPTQSDPTQSTRIDRAGAVADPCIEQEEDVLKITNVAYSGSGCSEGSVLVNLSDSLQALTLVFTDFAAALDPFIAQISDSKACNIVLEMNIPVGYSFSLSYADFRGYAFLDSGSQGSLSSRYNFIGDDKTVIFRHSFASPFDAEFQKRDELDFDDVVWSPCGTGEPKSFSLDSRILLNGAEGSSSFLSIDSIDNDFSQEFGIQWKEC